MCLNSNDLVAAKYMTLDHFDLAAFVPLFDTLYGTLINLGFPEIDMIYRGYSGILLIIPMYECAGTISANSGAEIVKFEG